MKKLILVLAILVAAPAFALVVEINDVGVGDGNVAIQYKDADADNLPRAFALEVSITGGIEPHRPVFTDINDYWIGESNSVLPSRVGYGIYPAQITWWLPPGDQDRDVNEWGDPLARRGAAGAQDQNLPSADVVLEFASLYYGDINAPATSGTLCTLKVDCNSASGRANILVEEEDEFRGGIVLEDGNAIELADVNIVWVCVAPPSPPGQATTPNPGDGTPCIGLNPTLTWVAGPNTVSHNVYFGTVNPPGVPEFKVNLPVGTTNYVPAGPLANNQTYYWRIDEVGAGGTTAGTVWSFTTLPVAPGPATIPNPGNGAPCIGLNPNLTWVAGAGTVSHNVYFGTVNPPGAPEFKINLPVGTTNYVPAGPLANNQTYFWRIDEVDICGTITAGTVWSFTTLPVAPGPATIPNPGNGAPCIGLNPNLTWVAGAGTVSHNVYFGTVNPPGAPEFKINLPVGTTNYAPAGPLANNQTYFGA